MSTSVVTPEIAVVSSLPSQLEGFDKDLDIDRIVLDSVQPHVKGLRIDQSIIDGNIVRTIEGASTIDLTVHDPERVLLESKLLSSDSGRLADIDLELDTVWFRMAHSTKSDDDFTFEFEDRNVAYLREHKKYRKASRGKMTRAQFVHMLVREVKAADIRFVSPHGSSRQPLAPVTKDDKKRLKDNKREPGFSDSYHPKIKGQDATARQKSNMEEVLAEGVKQKAPTDVLIAAVMTATQESSFLTSAVNGSHLGIFQQDPNWGTTSQRTDPTQSARKFFKVAIPYYNNWDTRHNGPLTLIALCEGVQHSGQASLYGQWQEEATQTVKDYNGGSGASQEKVRWGHYEFTRGKPGKPEDSWTCMQRLAKEVNWRCFSVSGTIYFVSDEMLFRSRPYMTLERGEATEGIDNIDFDIDNGKKTNQLTVECKIHRWAAPPGSVVEVKKMGTLVNGRWLVKEVTRPLFTYNGTVTLIKPTKEKPEPRPRLVSVKGQKKNKFKATGLSVDSYPLAKHGKLIQGPNVVGGTHDPNSGQWEDHNALDIGVPRGTEVYAVDDGVIGSQFGLLPGGSMDPSGRYAGLRLHLKTKDNEWYYAHLMEIAGPLVRPGAHVKAGDFIGKSGTAASVDHLHIACARGNPQKILGWGSDK